MQNFRERLETAIVRSKKPKGELAAHCGVALSTVSRWLAGSIPKQETLEVIASFLEVDAKWLLFGGDDLASETVLREDPTPYRVTPRPHIRYSGEPSIEERMEEIERNLASSREITLRMMRSLDELRDLFKNQKE